MREISVMGIDLAKNVFQFHGRNNEGKTLLRKRLARGRLLEEVAKMKPCVIGIEACGGSHYWAREFKKLGHEVRMIPPQFVKPYVKSNKNDAADAEAICEAVTRPEMRFVSTKSEEQQVVQSIHRIRERLVKHRTSLSNEIRGILHEFGIALSTGCLKLSSQLIVVQSQSQLPEVMKGLLTDLQTEWRETQERILSYESKLKMMFSKNEICQRLQTVPGVGIFTATAILSGVANAKDFKNGRGMSAWLGLVPRQNSSGGKTRLLGISKRGDGYLRKLLVHGARSVVRTLGDKQDALSCWVRKLVTTRGHNKACVALANKNARILWALLTSEKVYQMKVL